MPEPSIIVGVAGGIAAYKAADVVSALRKRGARVTVLLTKNAHHFVAPLTLKTLSGRPVGQDLFTEPAEWGIGHVNLAKEADAFVIVAATADLLARLATGQADDFVSACALVYHPKPLLLAPAMNTAMWQHPAVRANLRMLKSRGAQVLDPESGLLACGDVGEGKMVDPTVIVEKAYSLALRGLAGDAPGASGRAFVASREASLSGKRVLVTAGPTREPLDPVRFISNPSSGKMGFAIAEACRDLGAQVTLVSGPVSLADPEGLTVVRVQTALQMLAACQKAYAKADAVVAAAAVSDYRPSQPLARKKKKDGKVEALGLTPNPDILLALSKRKGRRVLVGFAAETDDLLKNAKTKLQAKNLDMLVANAVGPGKGFEVDAQAAVLLRPGAKPEALPLQPKRALAGRIADEVSALLAQRA